MISGVLIQAPPPGAKWSCENLSFLFLSKFLAFLIAEKRWKHDPIWLKYEKANILTVSILKNFVGILSPISWFLNVRSWQYYSWNLAWIRTKTESQIIPSWRKSKTKMGLTTRGLIQTPGLRCRRALTTEHYWTEQGSLFQIGFSPNLYKLAP